VIRLQPLQRERIVVRADGSATIEAAPNLRPQIHLRLTRVKAGPTWTAYASLDGIAWLGVTTTTRRR
jgi:hypothetical protein